MKTIHAPNGAQLIAAERKRQTKVENGRFSKEHDQMHASGELCDAAISYARAAAKQARGESLEYLQEMVSACEIPWPWEDQWWKPSADPIRNLEKAGALIAAEIDRLLAQRRLPA